MDNNPSLPNQNPTSGQTSGTPNTTASGPAFASQQPSNEASTSQTQVNSNNTPATSIPTQPNLQDQTPLDSPKITLNDLYGPSQATQNPNTQSVMPQQVQPNGPAFAQPSTLTPVQAPDQSPLQSPAQVSVENLPKEPIAQDTQPELAEAPLKTVSPPTPPKPPVLEKTKGGFGFPPIIIKIVGILFVILLIVVIFSFISSLFHKDTGNGKVTLTYWGLWEDSNVMQGIISDFERQNPNITINYTREDPVKYVDRLLTRLQNGNGPDIFRLNNTWIDPLQNTLLPLPNDVIDTKTLKDEYFPVVSDDLVRNGAIYGIPLDMDVLVLYINKDIFDHAGAKIPSTWEDFVTVAKGLTVKDSTGHIKTAGAAMGTYDNVSHAPDILSLLFLQNGANLSKLDNSQNAIDALNFYTSFAKTDDRVWDSTLDNSLTNFENGNLAMYFGYSYDYFAIKAANPKLNFEIHEVPHLSGRNMSVANYWVEGVSSKSTHQKEALLFMKYLAQKDNLTRLYSEEAKTRQFGEIYPRIDMAKTLSSDPVLLPFVSSAQSAMSSFFVSGTNFTGYNDALNQYLGNSVNSMLKDTSADSAVSTLSQGVSQVLNQYAIPSQ
ncbi:MAG TPA: extracellular solute-binding protein [Patescibacteria group bacterium]